MAVVVVAASSGVVRGVGTVHGPVGIGCGQRVAGWMGIDQPGGQQDAFAGCLLLYPLHHHPAKLAVHIAGIPCHVHTGPTSQLEFTHT